jgi:hypothetical protein
LFFPVSFIISSSIIIIIMPKDETSEESSSYEEESESYSDRAWTCDDIYPTDQPPANLKKEAEADDGAADDESSSLSTEEGEEETTNTSNDSPQQQKQQQKHRPAPPSVQHSSREAEMMLKSQAVALKSAHDEEQKRRLMVSEARNLSKEKNDRALDDSASLAKEFEDLSREYDSSDENMQALEQKLTNKRNNDPKKASGASLEETRFKQRNLEREMRLAKARERIEKKKDEQETKAAEETIKEQTQKLDMSKSARVERAYSWYTRMAMPNRDKMKERVQFMPASAGVTPDDVDLLPWNARGTFVSVASMMRMNRTGFLTEKTSNSTGGDGKDDSESD